MKPSEPVLAPIQRASCLPRMVLVINEEKEFLETLSAAAPSIPFLSSPLFHSYCALIQSESLVSSPSHSSTTCYTHNSLLCQVNPTWIIAFLSYGEAVAFTFKNTNFSQTVSFN
ncbi:hypothetical protein E2C01_013636 [Portunus trituberculatus]|uniref:Uncharacterized protein n=1 Tax=Portunus trituberculatus TaxID=210409 RepID=A0A5B7DGS9_PORTR|nr:hypothetical protein [Portunus trituberculatus]